MPRINIQMFPRTIETKRELIQRVTEVVVDVCKVSPDAVTILIEEMADENYGHAGVLRYDKKNNSN